MSANERAGYGRISDRTPVLKLWDVLLVTVRGELMDVEAEVLSAEVLNAVHRWGPRGLVIDLSGAGLVDSHLCRVIADIAQAAALMGTPSALSGLGPEIALALETMGVSFRGVQVTRTAEAAFELFGVVPAPIDDEEAEEAEEDEESSTEPEERVEP